jgi:hypothetical protein
LPSLPPPEVRWVAPEETDELTAGAVYEPVRCYLREVTGGTEGQSADLALAASSAL